MKIENLPFPHIIIENHFSKSECNLIWREIDFLSSKLKGPADFSAATNYDGEYLTNSSGLCLDSVYGDRSVSDILRIFESKLFDEEFYSQLIDSDDYWECLIKSDKDFTKLRKYTNEQDYQPHQDVWVNVLVSTTFEKEQCSGGDLVFPSHAYIIPTKHNQTIIFPGWVKHGVTPVMTNDRFAITKFIHCSVPNNNVSNVT